MTRLRRLLSRKMNLLAVFVFASTASYLQESVSAVNDVEFYRKSLEKELLRHSIHYLRTRLIYCLRQSPKHVIRTRRKVQQLFNMIEYELEMDILGNTKTYLMNRIIKCRRMKENMEQMRTTTATTTVTVPITTATEATTTTQATSPTVPTTIPTTAAVKTKETDVPRVYVIQNVNVTCHSTETLGGGRIFRCRDIWVNNTLRLPNSDICPPDYDPRWWKKLATIRPRTFLVLDLRGFCKALGSAVGYHGPVLDLRVVWDCEDSKMRMKWLHGKWSGMVKDNGFLHDIECTYGVLPKVSAHVRY